MVHFPAEWLELCHQVIQRRGQDMAEQDSAPISLLLVDDHGIVRMGLKSILALRKEFQVVAEAEDAADAVEKFREHQPDVTLMDIRMPGGSGVDAVREIRDEFPDARILMLTSFFLEEEVFQSLDAGAQGYVLKSVELDELAAAIQKVHSGNRSVPKALEQRLAERAETEQLSAREKEVLDHVRRGFSNKEIAIALGISEHTAKNHVKAIFRKMHVADRAEAVAAGFERGLFQPDEP